MHGLVLLDDKDNVIRPAILWNDGRTKEETDYLNNVLEKINYQNIHPTLHLQDLRHLRFYG